MTKKKVAVNEKSVQAVVAVGYPEVGKFTEKKELQKFYKFCTTEQLQEWVELEGLTITPSESAPIHRMRLAMAVLYLHFPKAPTAKKRAKYADYTLEDLINMAIDNDVVFEPVDDERILRMRAIMALKAAGLVE